MVIEYESDLMVFINNKYYKTKEQLETAQEKFDTSTLFKKVLNEAFSMYAVPLGFKTTTELIRAYNEWKKARKKGNSFSTSMTHLHSPQRKRDIVVDTLREEIEKYNLNLESYY